MLGVMRDVTDRREAAAALEASSTRLAGIVSIAADAIISMDERQTITMFNDGAEVIFGYARDELIGKPLTMLLPERLRAGHADHVRTFGASHVQARRMGQRSEITAQRKNGEVFPAEASISRLDVVGKLIFTAVLRDITERKHAQQLLEQRVEESTRELRIEMRRREESQAQLVRTQRMEAFGQLTGGIAHDFNNLLTVITGNLELAQMRLQDDKAKAFVQRAHDAAEMGARLTNRLLTFARRRRFEATPHNPNDLVNGMAELLERTLGEQITLTTSLEVAPWTILADPSEVENAILNLAINARDAMPKGGKLIIETANVAFDGADSEFGFKINAGDYVRLSVSDTGTGMPVNVLRHAFEPFFTTKEPGKGTGLGLSTIYGFVQQVNGTVTIYSEVGQGTTVNLYLPRAVGDSEAAAKPKTASNVPMASGERILLVEDNPDVRAVATEQLHALGYTVTAAASGPEALQNLTAERFDLVFSDVVMAGGMSGFDVARWVAAHAPGLPVVLTSGYPDGVLGAAVQDNTRPFLLRKPFSRDELARSIRHAIDGTKV